MSAMPEETNVVFHVYCTWCLKITSKTELSAGHSASNLSRPISLLCLLLEHWLLKFCVVNYADAFAFVFA